MSEKLFAEINQWLKQHRQGAAYELEGEKLLVQDSRLYQSHLPIIYAQVESYNVESEIQPLIDLADSMQVNPLEALWLIHVPGRAGEKSGTSRPDCFFLAEFEYREEGFYWDFIQVTLRIARALVGPL